LIMPTAYIMLIGLERVDSKIGSFYRRSWVLIAGILGLIILLLVFGVLINGPCGPKGGIF
jgi:hypothetical protein